MASIFNRAGAMPEDGFIHAVPLTPSLPNPEAGIDQVLDGASMNAILSSWSADEQRLGNRWPGIYIGEEHHIYLPSQSSAALGWAKERQLRSDGIYVKPDWTPEGADAIQNKRFKFTSFAVDGKPDCLEPLGGNRYRVLKVDTIGLTNLPNGKDLLNPITNRAAGSESPAGAAVAFTRIVNRIKAEGQLSFDQAWNKARIQHQDLYAAMGWPARGDKVSNRTAPIVTPPADQAMAGQILLRAAQSQQKRAGGGFDASWQHVCNRYPRLLNIAAGKASLGSLQEWEGAAHAAYMKYCQHPYNEFYMGGDVYGLKDAKGNKIASQNVRDEFMMAMRPLGHQFPDLGYEGRWEKMKEINPTLFWHFVSTFGPDHLK